MMMSKNKANRCPLGEGFLTTSLRNESGAALITALLLMVIMLSLMPVAMQLTTKEVDRSRNFKQDREAFFVAEAGLEHAKALTEASTLNDVLAGPDGDETDTTDNGTFGTVATGGTQELYNGIRHDKVTFGNNTYYIRAKDNVDGDSDPSVDSDSIMILAAVGIAGDTTATVETTVYNPPPLPTNAVTANGILSISGNPDILGVCGSVHSNGDNNPSTDDLVFSGDVDVAVNATTSGTSSIGSPGEIVGTIEDGAPEVPVPDLNPTDYQQYADYTFTNNGLIFQKGVSSAVYDANTTSLKWNGWDWSPPTWTLSGGSTINGSFYFDADVSISGSPPGPGIPPPWWETTIVAEGHLEVSGNPKWENKKDPNLPEEIQNIFLLAGTDIKMNGNNEMSTVEGLIYAREQIDLSGNSKINGSVMSLNEFSGDTNPPHGLIDKNFISGNSVITYGCGLYIPGIGPDIEVISWRQK